jgi:hypothetical protein
MTEFMRTLVWGWEVLREEEEGKNILLFIHFPIIAILLFPHTHTHTHRSEDVVILSLVAPILHENPILLLSSCSTRNEGKKGSSTVPNGVGGNKNCCAPA